MNNKELIAICIYCNKVVFRGGELQIKAFINNPSIFNFTTQCPHCQRNIKVKIEIKIKTETS